MKIPFKDDYFSRYLVDKVFVFSIDDEGMISIRELKDDALILLPEQIPEMIQDRNVVDDELANKILLAFSKR
ncbi:hypothetical protein [Neisseria dumasiana]|uniref:hypothetical protein n=1 Tax=Neisseria dumasiana TaxID=1931275 RepID=UPI00117F049F|nr:hypothetical protein [Neisseria dumasiana]UOO84321.1 hypothetical protein LVJ88_11835 [Neisseria dumasiana]